MQYIVFILAILLIYKIINILICKIIVLLNDDLEQDIKKLSEKRRDKP